MLSIAKAKAEQLVFIYQNKVTPAPTSLLIHESAGSQSVHEHQLAPENDNNEKIRVIFQGAEAIIIKEEVVYQIIDTMTNRVTVQAIELRIITEVAITISEDQGVDLTIIRAIEDGHTDHITAIHHKTIKIIILTDNFRAEEDPLDAHGHQEATGANT